MLCSQSSLSSMIVLTSLCSISKCKQELTQKPSIQYRKAHTFLHEIEMMMAGLDDDDSKECNFCMVSLLGMSGKQNQ